jgi:hypothetical protein
MGFRAFFLIYVFLFCGVVAFADVVVENNSNDTLHVGAIFGDCCLTPEGNCIPCDLGAPTKSCMPESNGFWTVAPQSTAVLLKGKTTHKAVWLRVIVKSPAGRAHELFPVGATRVRISPPDCGWTSGTPSFFVCNANYKFSSTSRSFPVNMGAATTTNHLRNRVLEGRSYEFFQIKTDASGSSKWTWNEK